MRLASLVLEHRRPTLTVIANFAVRAFGPAPPRLSYAPLIPLFLLLISGLSMVVLPCTASRRAAAVPGGSDAGRS